MPDEPVKGLKQSPLKLNRGLGALVKWDENAIRNRAKVLAEMAVSVWAAPKLPQDILDAYRPRSIAVTSYTIDDHPYLTNAAAGPLFDAFRKSVIALDPCISEEFLRLYVAYKAETNFVDVIPQARRLKLSLNMRFSDVNDPKGLCKDVTNKGKWGNGDVNVKLSSLDELPYVIGLVRQSLELQLGNGGDQ